MKTVILAGGLGTRLAEETEIRPKPMVEIGGQPILWHIIKQYSHYGFREFFIALGYKSDYIKRYFLDYGRLNGDLRIQTAQPILTKLDSTVEDWDIHLVNTGSYSNTGGRIFRLREYLCGETFMVTYGDGVSDVDIPALLNFHRSQGKIATVTAVRPPARFGGLQFEGEQVVRFSEKSQAGDGWINGGFIVFEPQIFNYLTRGDEQSMEAETLERLAAEGQLAAYKHYGFWQCMDTLRDKHLLEDMWKRGNAPWKLWA